MTEDQERIDEMKQVAEAIAAGNAIVCYTRCWPCMTFEGCYEDTTPHTWMDKDDAEHAGLTWPLSAEDAAARPCACDCGTPEPALSGGTPETTNG